MASFLVMLVAVAVGRPGHGVESSMAMLGLRLGRELVRRQGVGVAQDASGAWHERGPGEESAVLQPILVLGPTSRTLRICESGHTGRMTIDAYKALAEVVLVGRPLDEVLDEVAGIAQAWLPGSEATSVTLMRADKAWTAAYSGPLALNADELQYQEGYGPCMDAGRTGMPMVVTDMRTEERWPTYTPRVLKQGVLSSLSVPLPFQGLTIGALNNYSREPNAFGDDALQMASEITAYIGIAVMNADAHAEASAKAVNMQKALESRKTIDMALGILIATHHCSPEEAFTVLSQASQRYNRKLRELAADLVNSESAPGNGS